MQAVRIVAFLTFFLGTFSVRGLQVAIAVAVHGSESISMGFQPAGHFDSNSHDDENPQLPKRLRVSRIPRIVPPKCAPAGQALVQSPLSAVLSPSLAAMPPPWKEAAVDLPPPDFLADLFSANAGHNRAPPAGFLA